jgi:hypothetical protein
MFSTGSVMKSTYQWLPLKLLLPPLPPCNTTYRYLYLPINTDPSIATHSLPRISLYFFHLDSVQCGRDSMALRCCIRLAALIIQVLLGWNCRIFTRTPTIEYLPTAPLNGGRFMHSIKLSNEAKPRPTPIGLNSEGSFRAWMDVS